jgi:hypothetical protein
MSAVAGMTGRSATYTAKADNAYGFNDADDYITRLIYGKR